MILLLAILVGAVAGYARALAGGRSFTPPTLQGIGWAFAGFLPQFVIFFFPPVRGMLDQSITPILFVASLLLLLVFVWQNRSYHAFYLLGIGLILNLLVIVLNGGLMPISPETLDYLAAEDHHNAVEIGHQLGYSKNVVLYTAETRLEWLADRFLFPEWSPIQAAYSLGDVFIAVGAFWLMWQCGGGTGNESDSCRGESKLDEAA